MSLSYYYLVVDSYPLACRSYQYLTAMSPSFVSSLVARPRHQHPPDRPGHARRLFDRYLVGAQSPYFRPLV
jgi:hypothetical protein